MLHFENCFTVSPNWVNNRETLNRLDWTPVLKKTFLFVVSILNFYLLVELRDDVNSEIFICSSNSSKFIIYFILKYVNAVSYELCSSFIWTKKFISELISFTSILLLRCLLYLCWGLFDFLDKYWNFYTRLNPKNYI